MTVTCPTCGTRYNLTAKQLGASGRNLKCARCGHQWFVPPATPHQPGAEEDLPPPLPPVNTLGLEELGNFAHAGRTPMWRRKAGPLLPWLVGALAMLAVAGYIGHGVFIAKPAASGPSPITIPQPEKLQLRGITRDITQQGSLNVLTIAGTLTNTGKTDAAVPELRVQLLDAKGIELDFWPAELGKTTLAPDETVAWQARFLNPPLERLASFRAFFMEIPANVPATEPMPETTAEPPQTPSPTATQELETEHLSPSTVAPVLTPPSRSPNNRP